MTEPLEPHWSNRAFMIERHAEQVGKGAVALIGDSILEGFRGDAIGGRTVINCGFAGIRTRNMADRVANWIGGVCPSVSIVMVGINSVPSSSVGYEEQCAFKADYLRMLQAIKAATLDRVVACTILPVEPGKLYSDSYPNSSVDGCNAYIAEACQAAGVAYYDTNSLFRGKAGWTIDGIHPNAAGYARLRMALERVIAG